MKTNPLITSLLKSLGFGPPVEEAEPEGDYPKPATLDEATAWLIEEIKKSEGNYEKFVAIPKSHLLGATHHGFGTWLRNTLMLWHQGTPLVKYMKATYGIDHADDISGTLIQSAHALASGYEFSPTWYAAQCLEHWEKFK